jgi:cytochrome c-type biogenesis protein CcmE
MLKRRRFIIGGLVILAALSYIIWGGMQEAIVYFVTPSELKAQEHGSVDKFLRMGPTSTVRTAIRRALSPEKN